jgi:DNA polymerase-1
MALVFDIETDGLWPEVSKVYVLCTEDTDTGEQLQYSDYDSDLPPLQEGLEALKQAKILVGHNIIGYDLMVLKYLLEWEPAESTTLWDTLIMSQVNRYKRGHLHKLAAWGDKLKFPKGDYNDWTNYNKEMLKYCIQDVSLNVKVYQNLVEEVKSTVAINPLYKLGLQTEMEFAVIEAEIRSNGWLFDVPKANSLLQEIESRMETIRADLEPRIGMVTVKVDKADEFKTPAWRKDGYYNAVTAKYFNIDAITGRDEYSRLVDGPYCRIAFEQGNLSSDKVLKSWLFSLGWEPDEYNREKLNGNWVNTGPKLTDTSLAKLGEVGNQVSEYNTLKNRRGIIAGWLEASRNGRLHGNMWTVGTPTFRCRHEVIANLPSVALDKEDNPIGGAAGGYGYDMRSLFICEEGKVVVGADSSGNQMRGLCHYINNDEFTNEVINGDVHQRNADTLSLVVPTPRKKAKPFLYAYLFGGGPGKLGSILTGTSDVSVGKKAAAMFESSIPGLKELKDKLLNMYESTSNRFGKENAFIRGLDGRIVFVASPHMVLNYLLQTAEGITCKAAAVYAKKKLKALGIPYQFVLHMHDEYAIVTDKQYGQQVKEIMIESFIEAPKQFGIMCMGGDGAIGENYAAVH